MENPHPISIAALVSSLVADVRGLFAQEVRLARHEMQHELRKLTMGLVRAAIGALLSLMAVTLFLLMLVHALHTYTGLLLWACYGIVGLIAAAAGGFLLYSLVKLGSSLRLWPFRTAHSLKEDAQWIKEQVLSTRT
ncbi:MAG: hypothetical protein K0S45_2789 [Nitrospira sp.]|jgi:hypothetical protein|nr:hypothetical protein [Nitrospira sp.]